ncbi:unnamed protein product [Withania somnifera]
MDSLSCIGVFFVIFLSFLCSSQGYEFYVGGKKGWILEPSEPYSQWVKKNRFQINDTIVFKYKKGSDSVVVVHDLDDYTNCNKTSPIHHMKDGHSKLKFTRNGPFYFISGQGDNCEKGQKLLVVVMSPNHHHHKSPSPAPSLSPESTSPAPAPEASAAMGVGSSVLLWLFSFITIAVFA